MDGILKRIRYRSREAIREQKAKKTGNRENMCYLTGEHTSFIKVQASEGGELARAVRGGPGFQGS